MLPFVVKIGMHTSTDKHVTGIPEDNRTLMHNAIEIVALPCTHSPELATFTAFTYCVVPIPVTRPVLISAA
jgi:hypothetical protein